MAEKNFNDAPVYHDSFASGNGHPKLEADEALDHHDLSNNVSAMSVSHYSRDASTTNNYQDQESIGGDQPPDPHEGR